MEFLYLIGPPDPPPPQPVLIPDIERRDIAMPDLPETFLIRRGFGITAQLYGPYTAQEVTDHLASGALLPDDHYRATNGQWQHLHTTGLA